MLLATTYPHFSEDLDLPPYPGCQWQIGFYRDSPNKDVITLVVTVILGVGEVNLSEDILFTSIFIPCHRLLHLEKKTCKTEQVHFYDQRTRLKGIVNWYLYSAFEKVRIIYYIPKQWHT